MRDRENKLNSGFTLIELIVVIAIIGILVAIAVPRFADLFTSAKITADQATVRALNSSTQMLRLSTTEADPFEVVDNTNDFLIEELVSGGYLGSTVTPQTKDAEFEWLFDEEKWRLMFEDSFYEVTLEDFGTEGGLRDYGRLYGSYEGEAKDIVIPVSINDIPIRDVYQNLFNGKGLVAVNFDEESQLKQIHKRAFLNNDLTTIDFPDTLEKIDYESFANNDLTEITLPESVTQIEGKAFSGNGTTKVTIGASVTISENSVFGDNTYNFTTAYTAGGAGTYSLINGLWVKD